MNGKSDVESIHKAHKRRGIGLAAPLFFLTSSLFGLAARSAYNDANKYEDAAKVSLEQGDIQLAAEQTIVADGYESERNRDLGLAALWLASAGLTIATAAVVDKRTAPN